MFGLPDSERRMAALRRRMVTLYVSRKQHRKIISQDPARMTLIQRIARQPRDSARAPAMAGPIAPPSRGAIMMTLIAVPRCSVMKISPTIAGFSTFEATAKPVSILVAMKSFVFWDKAPMTVVAMNPKLAMFMSGQRPKSSEQGAIRRGPKASPSSQMVTSRTEADLSEDP